MTESDPETALAIVVIAVGIALIPVLVMAGWIAWMVAT